MQQTGGGFVDFPVSFASSFVLRLVRFSAAAAARPLLVCPALVVVVVVVFVFSLLRRLVSPSLCFVRAAAAAGYVSAMMIANCSAKSSERSPL